MNLSSLGYTKKWLEFGLLNETLFNEQLQEFENGDDQNIEHFRYYTFVNWLASKEKISNKEMHNYLTLAKEDKDQLMAGAAVRTFLESTVILDIQFEILKLELSKFGDWTKKPILYASLKKRLEKETITVELYEECLDYKNEFSDNRLLVMMIDKTDHQDILADFENNGSGKRIRTLASKKLARILKANQK